MNLKITGEPKEIAAFVGAMQEWLPKEMEEMKIQVSIKVPDKTTEKNKETSLKNLKNYRNGTDEQK